MNSSSIFNVTVCIIGILILSVHIVNLAIRKNKRKDEKCLLDFIIFTSIHLSIYLAFTLIKIAYTSNPFIIAFYTSFYIMNNIELFLLFRYMHNYVEISPKTEKGLVIFNICGLAVFCLLDIINIFTGMFFTAVDGAYIRSNTMILSQGYQCVMFVIVFVTAILSKKLNRREKLAFSSYSIIPLIAIILQNIFKGYAIAYASIIIAIEVLLLFLNYESNIELLKQKEKAQNAQVKVMLSQIQPHFIYNSLSAISTLITIDPNKAQEALDEFTEYLRRNLSSLTKDQLIPFEDELRHIETYVSLEKLRFEDRINVIYDLKIRDFYVPSLSIQPIIENAIKHGILKKISGGTIIFKTYETESSYVVEINDDGVGFNMADINEKDDNHFGINNIKYRITKMCKGNIEINSEINKGTNVIITFDK